MNKNQKTSKRAKKLSLKAKLIIILIILLISFYVHTILFGKNSFIILTKLKEETKELTQEAIDLKNSNQKLQKEFFELKNLEPK